MIGLPGGTLRTIARDILFATALEREDARRWMAVMAAYTSAPDEARLATILGELSNLPDVLVVLNHPFWCEEGVEEEDRRSAVDRLLRECVESLHAFELNGTRKWHENAATIELARRYSGDESVAFVNGVLDAIHREGPGEQADSAT